MRRYSICILGCGPRGRHHAFNALNNAERFELVGLCDQDRERLEEGADVIGGHPAASDFRSYTDAAGMLAEEQPDIFCFATPPSIRLPLFELGVEAGIKTILFEKPMALTLDEARAIHRMAEANGVRYCNAHIHRYGAHWKQLGNLVADGSLGSIRFAHATSRGTYFAMITHLVDYLVAYAGADQVLSVSGHATGTSELGDGQHPSPDYVLGKLVLDNGVHGLVECGLAALSHADPGQDLLKWYDGGLTLRGSEGWAQAIIGKGWRAALRARPELTGRETERFDPIMDGNGYFADIARWLDDESTFQHPCRNERTYHGFEVAIAILTSALERREVTLPLPEDATSPTTEALRQALEGS